MLQHLSHVLLGHGVPWKTSLQAKGIQVLGVLWHGDPKQPRPNCWLKFQPETPYSEVLCNHLTREQKPKETHSWISVVLY